LAYLSFPDDAIIRYTSICKSTSLPRSRRLARLREWLETPGFGDSFVSGKTEGIWDDDKGFKDYVVPYSGADIADGVTFQLTAFLACLAKYLWRGKQPEDELHAISNHAKLKLQKAIVTTVSSMFPVLPIIILFWLISS
jgi:hypothetical protein